ncbi:hypothetical protein HF324_09265 [Chitinophaga oryzae]|uniref:Lipoprotein n=1 Tax=Chitinophaga oryzae TaxID=2725414 RepID=A0AAE6ZF76_9BACT|nr:hypothetical protein [Chitinophaga oryzae]QJB31551.1 hypothetical protein HF329_09615 [Chitinophaga oryzae]QJB38031.1 hypothetical protein HF324_09265 [Chitinophaga oryzae]
MKTIIYFLAVATVAIFIGCFSAKNKKMNTTTYVQSIDGPIDASQYINKFGYKQIGEWKLLNPSPLPLSDSDILTIKTHIPEWLQMNNKSLDSALLNDLKTISNVELKKRMKYIFTVFMSIESDVYLLSLNNGKDKINVYILKNPEKGIVYPFKDEEWNRNLSYNDKK